MRLGQLARKLGISSSAIAEHLSSAGLPGDQDPNFRLPDDSVRAVVTHFAPARLNEFFSTQPELENVIEAPVVIEPGEVTAELQSEPEEEQQPLAEAQPAEPAEVIRAPKVELQGLKVVGKIELPQPKKKPESEGPASSEQETQNDSRPPRRGQRQDRREQRQWKNPLEAKRQREEAEAERKRQQAAEAAKARRTQNYLKRVKSVPTKAVRRIEEEVVVESDIDTAPPPRTMWGKFVRWLTT